MYADQKTSSYMCSFCTSSVPWSDDNYYRSSLLSFRHKPVKRVDGYINLIHVDVTRHFKIHTEGWLNRKYRFKSVDEKLSVWDSTTSAAFACAYKVTLPCPFCGAQITGESTQNIFTCKYCTGKLGAKEALKPGTYKKEYVMGVGAENVPDQAIPFQITSEQAKSAVLALVQAYSQDFEGQDIKRRVEEELTAAYIPCTIADLSIKAFSDSDRGEFKSYQEILNWVCPDTTLYDIYLFDRLDPWDFAEVAHFDPAFMEGNVRVASLANNTSRPEIIDNLLAERISSDIKETFGLRKMSVIKIGHDFRRHNCDFLLLPIYYLDKRSGETEKDMQVRIAVNGQTGSAAALFLQGEKQEYYRSIASSKQKQMSPESTVRTKPMPIRYVKPPFLHEILPFEKAVETTLMKKLFGRWL